MTTITMDGQYYRRGDSEKRPVRILCVDAQCKMPVVYLDDENDAIHATARGFVFFDEHYSAYDLLPIPSPPKLVPFTRETWPGSRYVKLKDGRGNSTAYGAVDVSDAGITLRGGTPIVWQGLLSHYLHGDSHKIDPGLWKECGTEE